MIIPSREKTFTLSQVYERYSRLNSVIALLVVGLLFAAIVARSVHGAADSNSSDYPCLQPTIRLDDVVTFGHDGKSSVTVRRKLIQLGAQCRGGRLTTRRGREIHFFKAECWGNPPADYLEILERQRRQIAKLKRKYTVIEIACDLRQTV